MVLLCNRKGKVKYFLLEVRKTKINLHVFLCIVHNMVNKVCHDLTVKPLYVPIGFKESHKFIILPAAFFKDGHAFPVLLNAVFLFSDSSVIFLAEKLIIFPCDQATCVIIIYLEFCFLKPLLLTLGFLYGKGVFIGSRP